jgi:lysophospholipase L1-like esterase
MLRLLLVFTTVLSFSMVSLNGAPLATTTGEPERWEGEIRKFELLDRRTPPPAHPILFTGSSSIRLWTNLTTAFPGRTILNRGFGGSHMSDLVFYFDRVVRPYRPKLVVVYEGDNDLASGKSVEQVYGDFLRFLKQMREALPGTGVVWLATKPSPSRGEWLDSQRDLDHRLQQLAATSPHVFFVDTFHPLIDGQGKPRRELFQADRLHLNAAGYEVWREVIGRALEDLLPPTRSTP